MLFGRNKKIPLLLPIKNCSTGCSIEITTNKAGIPVSSRGVGGTDVNQGKLCLKGIFEHELFESAGRGKIPLIRSDFHEPWQKILIGMVQPLK
jgi:predicted molibdopterin-dependent oxidoreductase YjgC